MSSSVRGTSVGLSGVPSVILEKSSLMTFIQPSCGTSLILAGAFVGAASEAVSCFEGRAILSVKIFPAETEKTVAREKSER